jgi:VanZ family protein
MSTTSPSLRKPPTIDSNNQPSFISRYPRIHAIVWRALAVAWAGLIFELSTAGFGAGFTETLLNLMLGFAHLSLSPSAFDLVHFLLRKLAHLTEYAIFAMLIYGSAREDDPFRWRPQRAIWSALIAGAYSLTDEFHQRFVPGRSPSLVDCGIDTAGASLGMLIFYVRAALSYGRNGRPAPSESGLQE